MILYDKLYSLFETDMSRRSWTIYVQLEWWQLDIHHLESNQAGFWIVSANRSKAMLET